MVELGFVSVVVASFGIKLRQKASQLYCGGYSLALDLCMPSKRWTICIKLYEYLLTILLCQMRGKCRTDTAETLDWDYEGDVEVGHSAVLYSWKNNLNFDQLTIGLIGTTWVIIRSRVLITDHHYSVGFLLSVCAPPDWIYGSGAVCVGSSYTGANLQSIELSEWLMVLKIWLLWNAIGPLSFSPCLHRRRAVGRL